MSRPIAVVVSSNTVLNDERSRTSGNFSTKWFGSCKYMEVEVSVNGKINNDIKFSMAIDINNGNDVTKYNDVKNGSRIDYYDSNTFYICEVPSSQRENFMVKFFPV